MNCYKGLINEWESIGNKIIYNDGNSYKNEVFKIQKKKYEYLNIIKYSIEDKYIEIHNIKDTTINDILYNNQKKLIGKIIKIVNNKIFLDELNQKLENNVLLEKKYIEYSINKGQDIIYPKDDKNDVFVRLNHNDEDYQENLYENRLNSINSENIVTVFITTCVGFVIGTYIFNNHLK
tara:strand:+ start:618 stop:1151 length:534 start_codon:yes stop_codon:yes gene_type:complete